MLFFYGCEEWSKDLDEVTMKVPLQKIVFSPVDEAEVTKDTSNWYQKEVTFDLDSLMEANDSDYLEEAVLEKLVIGVLQPQNQNLAFLRNASVNISLNESFSHQKELGEVDYVSANAREVDLSLNEVELDNYLKVDKFYLRIYFEKRNHIEIQESTKIFLEGMMKMRIE
jgi:hypothetical protein